MSRRSRPIEEARPHREDVEWGKGTIFIRPQTAKQVKRGNTEGNHEGLMEKSTVVEIPADALRHSFATYRYALDGDASATARELGHASTDITFRHYARRDVTAHDAEAWFGTRPQKRPRNVIPMRGAGCG